MSREYAMTGVQYVNTSQGGPSSEACSMGVVSGVTPAASASGPAHHLNNHVLPVPAMGTQVIHIVGGRKLSTNDPSDEGSDDHDYYNEYQRELHPLHHRRNETTV